MLALHETPSGYALFSVESGQNKKLKLIAFSPFESASVALEAATSIVSSRVPKQLKLFLKEHVHSERLVVSDSKLGALLRDKLQLEFSCDENSVEIMRNIRAIQGKLLSDTGNDDKRLRLMSLGIAHSLSRYKLKFSPDKVDTMIVQAIGLLDDLDKELNTYAMRCREWYGWHFPELGKIVSDNITFARVVKVMGSRENASHTNFGNIISEEDKSALSDSSVHSMGTEISSEDIDNIKSLCSQVVELSEYRTHLFSYLKLRMKAIAPNLTALVGEVIGARLISHAGSLMSLAKHPASTIQILGAEKALFRALKTKTKTPKYGLLYNASFISQTTPKNKGKVSRILAAKCSLATRVDALGDGLDTSTGETARLKIEARMATLDGASGTSHSERNAANKRKRM